MKRLTQLLCMVLAFVTVFSTVAFAAEIQPREPAISLVPAASISGMCPEIIIRFGSM